jgi:hypothetical protein
MRADLVGLVGADTLTSGSVPMDALELGAVGDFELQSGCNDTEGENREEAPHWNFLRAQTRVDKRRSPQTGWQPTTFRHLLMTSMLAV